MNPLLSFSYLRPWVQSSVQKKRLFRFQIIYLLLGKLAIRKNYNKPLNWSKIVFTFEQSYYASFTSKINFIQIKVLAIEQSLHRY